MATKSLLRKLRGAASAACVAVLITCGTATAGAGEVPLVDGTHWTKSAPEVKKAYIVGLANAIHVDMAYQGDGATGNVSDFSPRVVKGMKGQTLDSVLEVLDRWYAEHPEQLQRPVIETLWFEMVVPGLKTNK